MRNKIICVLIIMSVLLAFIPYVYADEVIASGEEGKYANTITWKLTSDGVLTFEGEGEMKGHAGQYKPAWYEYRDIIKTVNISEGITNIVYNSFVNCSALTEVNIPESVAEIQEMVFWGCSALESIYIPEGVTEISAYCFADCESLTNINIPSSVTHIEQYAFNGCVSLNHIELPENIEYIGSDAFSDTAFYNEQTNWENGVLYCGNYLIKANENLSEACEICPETSLIAANAFYRCNIKSINIPDSVKYINRLAFAHCTSISSVDIPKGVLVIGEMAFNDCNSLNNITIPDSLIEMGRNSFNDTAFYNNTDNWEEDMLYLDNVLLQVKKLSGIYKIKHGTRVIAGSAFLYGSSVDEICIPQSVQYINAMAFWYCRDTLKVHYEGTEDEWNKINIGLHNDGLLLAEIDFNGVFPEINSTYEVIDSAEVRIDGRYGYYRININLTNDFPRNESYTLVAAAYDGNQLTEVSKAYVFGYSNFQQLTIFEPEKVKSIKLFAWKNFNNMSPLCEAKTIPVNAAQ